MPALSVRTQRRRLPPSPEAAPFAGRSGGTRVLRWKDGKRAVFMIEFDDSAPTQLEFAIPALKNRGIPGTFYINPGNGPWRTHREAWEREASSPGIELANHTFSHIGGATLAEFEREIVQANDVIDRLYPHRRRPRLRTWGRPGVPGHQWGIGEKQIRQVLARHHMVERPPFFGPPFSIKTIPDMLAWVDEALATGEMRHLVFHGVGGDWHAAPLNYFLALLDKLEAHADDLWLTDPLSFHKYKTERTTARIRPLAATASSLRLSLDSGSDPYFYDQPLTLATRLPPSWTGVTVTQGDRRLAVTMNDGEARYDALPGGGDIVLRG